MTGFSAEMDILQDIEIATAATAYTSPIDGRTICLVLNESLFFGDRLTHTLLNPNQLRVNGVLVRDVPLQFAESSTHSIYIPSLDLDLPLNLDGVISYLDTRKPSLEEWENCDRIELTSAVPWEPYSEDFVVQEEVARARSIEPSEPASRALPAVRRTRTATVSEIATKVTYKSDGDRWCDQRVRVVAAARTIEVQRTLYDSNYADTDGLACRLIACVNITSDDSDGDGLSGWADVEQRQVADATTRDDFELKTSKSERSSALTPPILARRWGIGLDTAHRTLRVTTQAGIRTVVHPLERRFRTRQSHLKFPTYRAKVYTDPIFSTVKSIRGYTCGQVFVAPPAYLHFYPMKSKAEAGEALMKNIQDVGIMSDLISDGAKEEIAGFMGSIVTKHHIKVGRTEPFSQWQNRAEGEIRELKKGVARRQRLSGSPKRLWCCLTEWVAAIRRHTAWDNPALNGRTPAEIIQGDTPDISEWAQFDWYEYVWYIDPASKWPTEKRKLGRWIGVASDVGAAMTFWILPKSCKPIARSSVQSMTKDERDNPAIQLVMAELDLAITEKIGDEVLQATIDPLLDGLYPEQPADDQVFEGFEWDPAEPDTEKPEADGYTPESMDEYMTAEVMLPRGGESVRAKVIGRKHDRDGRPVGVRNANPILDTREYEVEFQDGSTDIYAANLIAENMYAQVDSEGYEQLLMSEIVGHTSDGSAVAADDGFTTNANGASRPRITTKGWKLEVTWKDGTSSWVPLKDMKEAYPIQVAEYAVANKIVSEPAFNWWVRAVLRKRERIISKVKSRYFKRTHKYGVELPHTVAEALAIDAKTETTFWRDAIEKEMRNVMPAFEFKDNNKMPVGCKHITCHMIFDVKFDLLRKARFVAGGHQTDPPKESTYASVVSRDSVRLAFLIAALNDLGVLAADVQSAYINAPTEENVYTTAGPEFGKNAGRPVLIVRALYGLKSSGARWRDHISATLREGGFTSCKADPDVWMRAATKLDGFKYWEYVLVYSDDILALSHDPQKIMDYLASKYTLKEGSVKEPDTYLGAEIIKFTIHGCDDPEKPRWAMSSTTYIKRSIADVETELTKVGKKLPTKVKTPMASGYRPEIDQTPELDERRATYYQGLIGILRWACELGRIDMLCEVGMLSSYLVNPREGHLDQVFHIFGYLKAHERSALLLDDHEPLHDGAKFNNPDWSEFYPDAAEAIPLNAPEERGLPVSMTCYCDADHAGCLVTRRSTTGVLIFVNKAPILWYSKRQNTVETSTFGSEFIAMKTAVEMVEGLRYKLRMMGIPLAGPTSVLCDNEGVVKNTTAPESTLKKKHNAISYHKVRESQAAGTIRIAKEPGVTNLSDFLTKCCPGPRLRYLISHVLY